MSHAELRKQLEAALATGDPVGPNAGDSRQEISASLLRSVLLDLADGDMHPGSLWLRNVKIKGSWAMRDSVIRPRLLMDKCVFEGDVSFEQSEARNLEFTNCLFEQFVNFNQVRVDWNLSFMGSTARRGIELNGAKVSGRLGFDGLTCAPGDSDAIAASNLEVGDDMWCRKCNIEGRITLRGSRVGGMLLFEGSTIRVPPERGYRVLVGDGMTVGGGFFGSDLRATGEVRISRSRIDGVLALERAVFDGLPDSGGSSIALRADNLDVRGMVRLPDMKATGRVSFVNSVVGGQLAIDRATVKGELVLLGAEVSSELGLIEATLEGDGTPALAADRLNIGGGLFCNRLAATGEVRLPGVRVGGPVEMAEAVFREGDGFNDGIALNAEKLKASGAVRGNGIDAQGGLTFSAAEIGGRLSFKEAKLRQGLHGRAILSLVGASVDDLRLQFEQADGTVDLRHAHVRTLWDGREGKVERFSALRLDGFRYESLATPLTAKDRLEWIEPSQSSGYYPAVYRQLASAFRRIGHRGDAREVEIAGARCAIQQLPHWRPRWLWNKTLWVTTGSGYRNWLAGLWLLGLLAIGSLTFWCNEDTFLPLLNPHPDFNPVLYAVDATVPILEVGQQRAFAATGWMRWMSLFLSISGYVLVTAVIAAAAGLLNPEERS